MSGALHGAMIRHWAALLLAGCWSVTLCACSQSDVESGAAGAPAAGSSPEKVSLDEATREYLWQMEHHVNVLVEYGLKAFGRALAESDADSIDELLAGDFEGRLFEAPREVAFDDEGLCIRRWERSSGGDRPLERSEFIGWLLEQRALYAQDLSTSFGVKFLSPDKRTDLEGPWHGVCKLTMRGEAASGGPRESTILFRFRTVHPTRERLAEPGWWLACTIDEVANARASRVLFREVAAERGLQPGRFYDNWKEELKNGHTGGIYACDYNRDNCVDLLVTDYGPPGLVLYQGLPDGRFKDVTRQVGLAPTSGRFPPGITGLADDCTFADLDNDGWEDLIVNAGGLYRNIEGRSFAYVGHLTNLFALIYGPEAPKNPPTSIVPGDFDRDGLVDLYVVRGGHLVNPDVGWIDEDPLVESGNQLLRNLGQGRFEDVTGRSGTQGGGRSVFTSVWLDANNDNWPDIYVINEFGKGLLLVNQTDGTFAKHELVEGLADFGSMGLTCGDIDNDGHIDIYSANMYSKAGNRVMANIPEGTYSDDVMRKLRRLVAGSRMYRNLGGLKFENVGQAWRVHDAGWSWGASLADLNNDGWLDLYATCGYMSRDRSKPDG